MIRKTEIQNQSRLNWQQDINNFAEELLLTRAYTRYHGVTNALSSNSTCSDLLWICCKKNPRRIEVVELGY